MSGKGRLKIDLEAILGEEILSPLYGTGKLKTTSGKEFFLKCGDSSDTYRCEANGLKELTKPGLFHIPKVYSASDQYILTEYIPSVTPSSAFHEEFGRRFAQMHRFHGAYYGFYEDNFIGANVQLNIPSEEEKRNWVTFYFNKRLLFQYRLAENNGYVTSKLKSGFSFLESHIEDILKESEESPTLLHGDLWSGNYLCDKSGVPALIDPAVYYGHREADLAMTKVFGGFSPTFYIAYMNEYPLSEGWECRENIYKLYHILNHLNLFGRAYLAEAEYLLSNI